MESTTVRWRLWAGIAVAAAVAGVGWLVWHTWFSKGFEWALFASTFRALDPAWLAASAVLAWLTYLGRALRWRVLIRPQKANPSLWGLFVGTAIGFTAVVLFGRPGELVRPYVIGLKERLSFSSQVAAWLVERMYDLMMALLIFGVALSQVKTTGVKVGEGLQWVLAMGGYAASAVAVVCLGVFLALRQFGGASERRIRDASMILPERYRGLLARIVGAFSQGIQSTKDSGAVIAALFYSVLEWALIVACYACIFRASPATEAFGLMDVLIFVGFVSFGNVVQIPGIGGGMQIVTVVVLTELFGMPVEVSGGLAIVLWAITFVVIVPFGLILAFHDGLNWGKLRQIRDRTDS
jgi:glycosyltransferase 2 family protein